VAPASNRGLTEPSGDPFSPRAPDRGHNWAASWLNNLARPQNTPGDGPGVFFCQGQRPLSCDTLVMILDLGAWIKTALSCSGMIYQIANRVQQLRDDSMPILITDFDGTFTRRDFFDLIIERHDPPGARAGWQKFTDGKITLSQGLDAVFASLRTDAAGADALVRALDPAPGVVTAVQQLQAAGWEVVIASAGCGWYIERLLARMGLDLKIHASPGTFSPATGLLMRPDPDDPYYHPALGIDKPAVTRAALARDPIVAYAGDSNNDRAGAMLIPPERRFVTGWLARRLAAEGVPHVPFDIWPEIAERLLG